MEEKLANLRSALQHEHSYLSDTIDSEQILPHLFSNYIITVEEMEHINCQRQNFGATAQAKLLVEYVMKKDLLQIMGFMEVLRDHQNFVFVKIDETIKGIESGEIHVKAKESEEGQQNNAASKQEEFQIKNLTEHLRNIYLNPENRWCKLEPIPGLDQQHQILIDIDDQPVIMTPVFKAEKLDTSHTDNKARFMPAARFKEKYFPLDKKHFDELFGIIQEENTKNESKIKRQTIQKQLIFCTGISGVGKTTSCQRLVWQWANNKSTFLSKYDAMFVVPVRDVKHSTIMDILSKDIVDNNGNGLVPVDQTKSLDEYLKNSMNVDNVAFIVDGMDENDLNEELQNLINGKLYSGCTVMITARPESLKSIEHLTPCIKVELIGTDEESVARFISETIQGQDKSEVDRLYQNCKEQLSDFGLLKVPLYLTLICFIFNDMFSSGADISDFNVPDTMTSLFNSFLNVNVRRWLSRQNRIKVISYQTHPLGNDSTIPEDVKRLLFHMGNLCYSGLQENKYEFNSDDLRSHFLTLEDLTDSGLFCVIKHGDGQVTINMHHKQFQEYLAALYLSCSQHHNGGPIGALFHRLNNKQDNFLLEVIANKNLVKTVQFSCGMSSAFFQYVLSQATETCAVMRIMKGVIDIYYEASLLAENNCKTNQEAFWKYLVNCKVGEKYGFRSKYMMRDRESENKSSKGELVMDENFVNLGNRAYYEKTLSSVLKVIPKDVALELICRFYDFYIITEDNKYSIFHLKQHEHEIACLENGALKEGYKINLKLTLDQLLSELLMMFEFLNVKTMQITYAEDTYMNIPTTCRIFPALENFSGIA